jgi:serine phosphatase RsbU (regulator of sigma subunit)
MNRARPAILAAAITEGTPARILMRANRFLLRAQSTGMVTAACCLFDPALMKMEYATAGYPPPIIVPVGSPPYFLADGGAPMGIVDDLELESLNMLVAKGSTVILYTDGLIEEEHDIVGGEQRLLLAAEQNRSVGDLSTALFKTAISDGKPRDNVAILTMRLTAP